MRSLKIPPVPLPRLRRAKQGKPLEDLSGPVNREDVNREETTNSDLLLSTSDNSCSFISGQKPVFHELQEQRDYEICEWDQMSISTDCKSVKEMNPFSPDAEVTDANTISAMEIPPLPPKSKSLLSGEDSSTVSLSPKPRKRLSVAAKAIPKEISKEFASQSQDGLSLKVLRRGPEPFLKITSTKIFLSYHLSPYFSKQRTLTVKKKERHYRKKIIHHNCRLKNYGTMNKSAQKKSTFRMKRRKNNRPFYRRNSTTIASKTRNEQRRDQSKERTYSQRASFTRESFTSVISKEKSFDENHLDLRT